MREDQEALVVQTVALYLKQNTGMFSPELTLLSNFYWRNTIFIFNVMIKTYLLYSSEKGQTIDFLVYLRRTV